MGNYFDCMVCGQENGAGGCACTRKQREINVGNHDVECDFCRNDARTTGSLCTTQLKADRCSLYASSKAAALIAAAKEPIIPQVGGDHYQSAYQHWDFMEDHGIGYLESCATKYVCRWRTKNGRQDLEKGRTYTEKLIHLATFNHRLPRGVASLAALHRFAVANNLTELEWEFCRHLTSWVTVFELNLGLGALRKLLAECDDTGRGLDHG